MFDIGSSEIFLILLVAIILINPKDLPAIIKKTKIFLQNFSSIRQEINTTISKLEESIAMHTELNEHEFEEFKKEYLEPLDPNKNAASVSIARTQKIARPKKAKIAKSSEIKNPKILSKPKPSKNKE